MAQRVMIEPVTRIEGHAKVSIILDDQGKVEQARLHVNEFRGFEKFCQGRMFYEMPQITPRICGICPVSHHLAAAKAGDAIVGVEPTRTASLLRELMHMGQVVQSHSMHFFELAGPDLLLGFDADPAKRNVAGLIEEQPEVALKGVRLRKFGQSVISALGRKRVHPEFAVAGGVNSALRPEARDSILGELEARIADAQAGVVLAKAWIEEHQDYAQSFASFPCGYMGTVTDDGTLDLYQGHLRLIDCSGALQAEFDPKDYLDYIGERVESWSYLKFPYYLKSGWPDGVYRVGPLARLNVCSGLSTPLAQAEWLQWKALNDGRPVQGTLYYHWARMVEVLYALERIGQILDEPEVMSDDLYVASTEIGCRGVGSLEAPRGTLIHDYRTDEQGKLTNVNLFIATGHNNLAMNRSVQQVAERYVQGSQLQEGMLNRVEAIIRCYDPCLSCASHAVGQMPLHVQLRDAAGRIVDEVVRR